MLTFRRSLRSSVIGSTNRLLVTQSKMANYSTQINIDPDDVIFENINNTKVITLNRPKKLNSLNASMVAKLSPRLTEYSKSEVTQLIIQKSNGRAFCAGGDVASCVENNLNGKISDSLAFFQQEYSLNYLLATYPKPVVSLLNGIVMGGGVGLSIHTPFRIATENTRWAMPEMDIGFSPDVGTTFALNKVVPSSFGWYLALTGENVYGWDNYFSGLATHYVPSHRLDSLTKALTNVNLSHVDSFTVINNIIEDYTDPLPSNYTYKYTPETLALIETVFHKNATVESIFEDLEKEGSEFALKTLSTLKTKSLLSLKVALELLSRGSKSNIYEALTSELLAAKEFMRESDFNEAVSSKLIKKSKDLPNWKYSKPEDIKVDVLFKFFRPDYSLKIDKHFDVTFKEYPFNFGLPKESEIKNFVNGEDGFKQDGPITKRDIFTHFTQHPKYKHKSGLVQYLSHVLDSKFESKSDNALSWKL